MRLKLFTLFALSDLVLVAYGAVQAAQPANQAVTLWLLALIAVTFVPKVKGLSRQPEATAVEALMPAK
jgi:hypothetical protein